MTCLIDDSDDSEGQCPTSTGSEPDRKNLSRSSSLEMSVKVTGTYLFLRFTTSSRCTPKIRILANWI